MIGKMKQIKKQDPVDPAFKKIIQSGLFYPVFILVFFSELGLLVVQIHIAALDIGMIDDVGAHIQQVAFADNDVGVFAGFNASGSVGNAKDPGRVEGNGTERFFFG